MVATPISKVGVVRRVGSSPTRATPTLAKGEKINKESNSKIFNYQNDEKPLNFMSRTGSSPVAASKIVAWWNW